MPPSELSLDGASGEAVIALALPPMQANGGNWFEAGGGGRKAGALSGSALARCPQPVRDDTRQIAVIQPELTSPLRPTRTTAIT